MGLYLSPLLGLWWEEAFTSEGGALSDPVLIVPSLSFSPLGLGLVWYWLV